MSRRSRLAMIMASFAALLIVLSAGCGTSGTRPAVRDAGSAGSRRMVEKTAEPVPAPADPYIVEAASYRWAMPEYWRGRATAAVDGDTVTVTAGQWPSRVLAVIRPAAMSHGNAGDIGSSTMGSVTLPDGTAVEVWATRWAFVAASDPTLMTGDEAAGLADLQSGGTLDYQAFHDAFDESAGMDTEELERIDAFMRDHVVAGIQDAA